MRVTKLIREYVESEVGEKFKPKYNAIGKEYEERRQKFFKKVQQLTEDLNNDIIMLAKAEGFDVDEKHQYLSFSSWGIRNNKLEAEYNTQRNDLRRRETETINSILLGLEMGETSKDELKATLAAIEV